MAEQGALTGRPGAYGGRDNPNSDYIVTQSVASHHPLQIRDIPELIADYNHHNVVAAFFPLRGTVFLCRHGSR